MKVTDLMIGDWVNMGNPIDDKLVPTKIENIYGEEINCKTGHTSDDVPTIVYGKWLRYAQPIPLTEEILTKNGWDFTNRKYGIYCEEDKFHNVELSRDDDGFYLSINTDEYVILRIDYVHQLQHLLQLCGVQKEIEL